MRRMVPFSVLALGVLPAGCGQPPGGAVSHEGAEGTDATREGTASTDGPKFQRVVDSYAVAHEEIEAEGGEEEVGPYRVGYIVEPAEGWWEGGSEYHEWREPSPDETHHAEILPFDPKRGLFIPEMEERLTVVDEAGQEVDSQPVRCYHAGFYHYANKFIVPEDGTCTLRAELPPPDFNRHGSEDGESKVFTEAVTVEFENVGITDE